ncbi:MAG: hypothetical protein IJO81_00995 [Clostridia bacterium]|nr:hypothetical protein [Clostridia bacterium]
MPKKQPREVEEKIRVDSEIKRRKNRYYEKVSDRYRTVGVLIILCLAVFGGVLLLKFGEYITYDNFVYLMRDFSSVTESASDFTEVSYQAQDSDVFVPFRDGFAAVGNSRVQIFDVGGSSLLTDSVSLSYPAAASSEKYLLVYDIGGTTYSIYNSITRVVKYETDMPIVCASVADDGSYIIVTEGKESKYLVKYYNSAFKLKMTVRKDKYVTDGAISRDGEYFAVSSVYEEGALFMGEVSFYKRGADSEAASYTYSTSMPVSAVSHSNGGFTVLFDDAVRFYNEKGESAGECALSGEKVTYFDAREDGCVLVCETNSIGTENRVYVFDSEGKITFDRMVSGRVYGVCMSVSNGDAAAYVMTAESINSLAHNGEDITYPLYAGAVSLVDTASGPLCFTPDRAFRFAFEKASDGESEDSSVDTSAETENGENDTEDTGKTPAK